MGLSIPFFARISVVIAIFLVALLAFHIYWVWWKPLDKIGWKKVDYLWLGLTIISLIGYVSQSRSIIAGYLVRGATLQMSGAYYSLSRTAEMYGNNNPGICRTFVRGPHSPPAEQFQRSQQEFNIACDWFNKVATIIPLRDKPPAAKILLVDLPPIPTFTEPVLTGNLRALEKELSNFNATVATHDEIEAQTHRSLPEEILVIFMPIFFAVALAMRITKVTGEIRVERRPPRPEVPVQVTPAPAAEPDSPLPDDSPSLPTAGEPSEKPTAPAQ